MIISSHYKVRTVDIAKGDLFCRTFAIASEADRIFTELKAGITQNEMITASKVSLKLDHKPLQELILSHLHPLP